MKNELTLRRMFGLAAIVALIGLVAASCDNAATTNIDCGYALCACGVCASASCDCESVADDCGYAECGCENCEGAGCDCDERQAQSITVQIAAGVTMTMNRIAPGVFTQGQDSVPLGGATRREVTLTRGFFMGIHSVTQEQFYAVMGVNPSWFSSDPAEGEEQRRRPVESVNWYHAIAFANRLSILQNLEPVYTIEGMSNTDADAWLYANVPTSRDAAWDAVTANWEASGFRLPTEAEWEFSACAGTDTQWSFGDTDDDIDYYAWTNRNAGDRTREVGQLEPNAWGLHDMHGNVWEWVWDRHGTLGMSAATDPTGAISGADRVMRGGSWGNSPDGTRSALRSSDDHSNRHFFRGFRVVRP